MAITLIANSAIAQGLVSATTTGIDTTGANFLLIALACDDAHTATPTDSKSNTWTELTSYTQTNVRVRLWYSVPTSVGTSHTFSSNGTGFTGSIMGIAFAGVKQTSPADQQSGANGFITTLQPGSITPSEDNELVWSHFGINASGSPMSIDSGFTEIAEADFSAGVAYGGSFAYKIQTTAAAVNPTWTRTDTNGAACTQASFKAAASTSNPAFLLNFV